jgi:hypothetical protein
MEHERSLPCAQEATTCHCRETVQSTPQDNINSIVLSVPSGFVSFPTKMLVLRAVLTVCFSHIPGLDQPSKIWRRLQIMKMLAMLISPVTYYFFPRRPKYRPQHCSPEHPQPVFLSTCYKSKFHSYKQAIV